MTIYKYAHLLYINKRALNLFVLNWIEYCLFVQFARSMMYNSQRSRHQVD